MTKWTKEQGTPWGEHPGQRCTIYTAAGMPGWCIAKTLTAEGAPCYTLLHHGHPCMGAVRDITDCKRRAERVMALERGASACE